MSVFKWEGYDVTHWLYDLSWKNEIMYFKTEKQEGIDFFDFHKRKINVYCKATPTASIIFLKVLH